MTRKDKSKMKNLFIIGNGFDCYAHGLPTKYVDFRDYILTKFPNSRNYCGLVPGSTILPDGSEAIDMEDVAGYIVNVIDNCGDGYWSDLEYYLGDSIFDCLHYDLDPVSFDAPDKITRHAVYNNEDISLNMQKTFINVKNLFCDWITDELSNIDYSGVKKANIANVLKKGDAFLNFNYTMTLEEAYGIAEDKICHIHGKVGDNVDRIFFGHGDKNSAPEWVDSLGADDNLSSLKEDLQKDVKKAFCSNAGFFNGMNNIQTIHSFGFGFGDVDMFYIEEIAKRVDLSNTIWYLNTFDSKCKDKKEKLIKLGFQVKADLSW